MSTSSSGSSNESDDKIKGSSKKLKSDSKIKSRPVKNKNALEFDKGKIQMSDKSKTQMSNQKVSNQTFLDLNTDLNTDDSTNTSDVTLNKSFKQKKVLSKKTTKIIKVDTSYFQGHRARLKDKCYQFASNLSDYEILEMILFWSIPRKDTKILAKKLLKEFGSLSRVLYASEQKMIELTQITRNTYVNFVVIREVIQRIMRSKFIQKHILNSWNALIEYLQTTMGDIQTENFRAIFLNKKNMIIADELQAAGTIDQTPVYPREIVKRTLFHDASALILVHNHPSGNPTPSKADISITQDIQQACKTFDITLHDHVIICKNKFFSFKSEQLL